MGGDIMKYKVHIEETLSKDIIVDAETRLDARTMIEEKIENGKSFLLLMISLAVE